MTETGPEIPRHVLEYLQQQNTLTLATASARGIPHASTFLYVNDGPDLCFWGQPGTTTARNMEQNPAVAFTIDEYTEDLAQTRGVQGTGQCSVLLSGEQIARVADLFGQKFPDLAPGATTSISFYRIRAAELQYIDNRQGQEQQPSGTFGANFHRERAYSVFSDLPTEGGEEIVASLQRIHAAAGETLVREGGPADKFLILLDGEAEVVSEGSAPTRLGPGDLFGELSILRDTPRRASVRVTSEANLLTLDRDTFRDLVTQSLRIGADFDKLVHERLGDS
jgi:uncharacterized protein YhbP (UPF0306 family)